MIEENSDVVVLKNTNKELIIGIPLSNQYPLLLPYPSNKVTTCKTCILGLLKSVLPILVGFGIIICLVLLVSYYVK